MFFPKNNDMRKHTSLKHGRAFAHLCLRVVDDLEFLSFLKSEVIFSASVVVIQSYKESDSTTCIHVRTHTHTQQEIEE